MFMPKDVDGYHNYLDKTVTVHPENQKKYVVVQLR